MMIKIKILSVKKYIVSKNKNIRQHDFMLNIFQL